jgi:hypothetical protein
VIEAATNALGAVDTWVKVRPMERAAAFTDHQKKTLEHLAFQESGAYGNASA